MPINDVVFSAVAPYRKSELISERKSELRTLTELQYQFHAAAATKSTTKAATKATTKASGYDSIALALNHC
jgi:hypothetical protein